MTTPGDRYVLRSVAGGLLSRGVGLVAGIVVTGVLVERLGADGYGLWVVLTTIATFASAVDGGVLGGLSRHVGMLQGAGRPHETRAAVAAAFALYLAVGLAILALAWALDDVVADVLTTSPSVARSTITTGLLVAVATWAVGNLWQSAAAAAEGADRMPAANALRAAVQATVAVCIVTVALWRPTVVAVLVAALVVTALAVPVSVVLLRRWTGITPAFRRGIGRWVRAEVSYGARLQVTQISYLSRDLVDRLVIGAVLSVSAVTGYHVAFRIAAITAILPGILIATALPLAARHHGAGGRWALDVLNRQGRRLLAVSALALGATSAAYANLATAWVGDTAAGTFVLFVVVAGAFAVSNTTGVLTTVLRAQGVLHPEMWGGIVAGVSNIPLTLWFAVQFGVVGVVVASAVATVLGNAAYLALVRGESRTHALHQVRAGLVAAVAVAPAVTLGALAPTAGSRAAGLGYGIVLAAAGTVVTLAMLRVLGLLRRDDVEELRSGLRRRTA